MHNTQQRLRVFLLMVEPAKRNTWLNSWCAIVCMYNTVRTVRNRQRAQKARQRSSTPLFHTYFRTKLRDEMTDHLSTLPPAIAYFFQQNYRIGVPTPRSCEGFRFRADRRYESDVHGSHVSLCLLPVRSITAWLARISSSLTKPFLVDVSESEERACTNVVWPSGQISTRTGIVHTYDTSPARYMCIRILWSRRDGCKIRESHVFLYCVTEPHQYFH